MSNCEHIEELFSQHFDGDLAPSEQAGFDAHVADCANCRASWHDYQSAVSALRASGHRETSNDLKVATLAAVEAAARQVQPAPRWLPLLIAAGIGAAAALLVVWLLPVSPKDEARADKSLQVAIDSGAASDSHSMALLPGETRSVGDVTLTRSATGNLTVRTQPSKPTVEERIVRVPVDRPVDRIVEVRVEVPVERIVEVPVEVRRGPLWTIDTSALATALRVASAELSAGMLALLHAPRPSQSAQSGPKGRLQAREPVRSPVASVPTASDGGIDLDDTTGASLRVQRSNGVTHLETSGPLEELVPTLLAQLESDDTELCSMIGRRLAAIHEEAAMDQNIRDQLTAMPDDQVTPRSTIPSLFSGRVEESEPASPALAWATWWHANKALITQSVGP
jgi:anti-sigma factor RsiW